METLTQDRQIAVINNSIEIFKTAPEILKANQERTAKAIQVGQNILSSWVEAWNIEDEESRLESLAAIDERSNNFLANCTKALKEEKELRAAITQMMDEFKKMFTAAENDIDKAKANTVPSRIQNNRDTYAGEVFKVQERKRKEAERIAAKAKEAIEIKSEFETSLHQQFNDFLLKAKTWLTGKFNALKLQGFADDAAQIRLYKPEYKKEAFDSLDGKSRVAAYHNTNEYVALHEDVKQPLWESFCRKYKSEMEVFQKELVDKIPSKHEELKEEKRLADEAAAAAEKAKKEEEDRQAAIAKANEEERKRLEAEAAKAREEDAKRQAELKRQQEEAEAARKKREEDEAAKMKAEADEAQRIAEQEAEIKKQGEQTMVMFEQEAAIAETQAPEARQGYEINITHQAGWVQIFQLWFENEGKNMAIDKIGGTKLEQMKAWAEKHAHKTGTKIESKFINYKESFKAVNRKAK